MTTPDRPLTHVEAVEYVNAYNRGMAASNLPGLRDLMQRLKERIALVARTSDGVPGFMLAGYQGYVHALMCRTDVIAFAKSPPTVRLLDPTDDHPSTHFTCPDCGRTSHNLNDVTYRYCVACHTFHEP